MSKIFQFDSPDKSSGFLLWKVNNLWQKEVKKSLRKFDLTHIQFVVLANIHFLSMEAEHVTQVDIANQLGIDKMLTSNVLKALLKKDLINRQEHMLDTRAKIVKLTKIGEGTLKKAAQNVEDFDKSFFAKLSNASKFNKELISLFN